MPWYAILITFVVCVVAGWAATKLPFVCRMFSGRNRSSYPEMMALGVGIVLMACAWPIVCGIMGWR
jgi:hypothetical protein